MKTVSEDGIRMLVAFEGEILKVYKDPVGLPTFGVGHLVTPDERAEFPVGKKITRAVSRQYLRNDLARFEACVNRAVKVPITQNQFDALVSLAFNIGEAGFRRSSVLRHLNNRKFEAAANAFGAWNKAGGRIIQGLVKRRATERSVFLTPDEPESTAANLLPNTTNKPPAQDTAIEPQPPSNLVQDSQQSVEQTTLETPEGTTTQTTTTHAGAVTVGTVKASLWSKIMAFGTVIYGYYLTAKQDAGELVDKVTGAIDAQALLYIVLGGGLVGIGAWLYNRSQERAHEKTVEVIKTAADTDKNTVNLG